MKKALQFIIILFLPLGLTAQIGLGPDGKMGINTDTPLARLDIRTTDPANPESHEGLLIPKVDEFPSTSPGAARDGMLVYATGSGSVAKGFYYWDQAASAWKQLASPTGTSAVYLDDLQDAKSDGSSVFIGSNAGQNDDGTSNSNVGIGYYALYSNTTGYNNTAHGYRALYSNTTGIANVAEGREALYSNTEGRFNTALGNLALYNTTTGVSNTALGTSALYSISTGDKNTALGTSAGSFITGSNNTAIGYNAKVPSNSASNQVRIGNYDVTYAGIQVGWTITSDARYKKNITGLNNGLAFVKALRPVNYVRKNNESSTKEMGFIAQEVEKVLESLGYENQGLLSKDDRGMYSLRYNDFIPLLTKAIQEQQEQIASQQEQVASQQRQIDELTALVGTLAEGQKSEPTPVSGPAEGAVLVSAAAPVPK